MDFANPPHRIRCRHLVLTGKPILSPNLNGVTGMPTLNMAAGTQLTYTGPPMAVGDQITARKSLGQHWLKDANSLEAITDLANISSSDTVVEIGPGTGELTKLLTQKARTVVAIELDESLVSHLKSLTIANLEVINADILNFNFENLPEYKLVANIPYYLTGKIIRLISELNNRPSLAVLLVQKEIADKLSAKPGDLSILGISCQFYWQVEKGMIVEASKFDPPPKVDSQIVRLMPKKPSLDKSKQDELFRLVKIGFSSKRKTLLNNLSSGYRKDKETIKVALEKAGIDPSRRAQTVSLTEWVRLLDCI